MPVTYCIIGGGVAGTSVLHELVKRLSVNAQQPHSSADTKCGVHIYMFERATSIGPGLAWGDGNSDVHLFNLAAGYASVIFGEWNSFLNWCKMNNFEHIQATDYPPRRLFSEYTRAIVSKACQYATDNGISTNLFANSEVTRLEPFFDESFHNKYKITFEHAVNNPDQLPQSIIAFCVFLCTGPASTSPSCFANLLGKTGYISSPWPYQTLAQIPREAIVGIIGTGLTAVDVVKQLYSQGHCGPVHMGSRRGLLPTIKARCLLPPSACMYATFPAVSLLLARNSPGTVGLLDEYMRLVKQEWSEYFAREQPKRSVSTAAAVAVESSGSGPPTHDQLLKAAADCFDCAIAQQEPIKNGVEMLREHLREYHGQEEQNDGRILWQECMPNILVSGVIQFMWSTLCIDEKKRFNSQLRAIFQVYNNPMPVSSGEEMLSYIERGWCQVRGGLLDVTCTSTSSSSSSPGTTGSNYSMIFSSNLNRSAAATETVQVDYLVNCTGFNTSYSDPAALSELYKDMIATDTVSAYPCGGLEADPMTGRVNVRCCSTSTSTGAGTGSRELIEEASTVNPQVYAVGYPVFGVQMATSGLGYVTFQALKAVDAAVPLLTGAIS
eukprot:CAMPEP_0174994460 /NCGR_PEP_ID=MMETSP0004_2-20121128/23643_1 /TAXON_ID=420556 /ORGANISM="Ochromonas sp., Strain CCMP1393" /LENGTH=608 /DNA_ID=CAMNT_0016248689 /DNA_START=88 /DNA_END=1914 /DNA_ORIENTATION=-